MNILSGQAEKISKSPVMVEDAQDGPIAAMARQARQAQIASAANDVDLTDNALADQALFRRCTTSPTNSWPGTPWKPISR